MDYITQWANMLKKSGQTEAKFIRNRSNRYGFQININHPLVNKKWEAFKKKKKIGRYGMTDTLRKEFEETFMKSKYYQKCIEQEKEKFGDAYDYIFYKTV